MTRTPPVRGHSVVAVTSAKRGRELDRATEIARANGASLHVVKLDRRERVLMASDVAEDLAARLLVVGVDRGRSRLPFAEQVHDVAGRAILQVRNPVVGPYRRVFVAIDVRSALREMMSAARFVAASAHEVQLLHAYQSPRDAELVSHGVGFAAMRHFRNEAARDAEARIGKLLARAKLDPRSLRLVYGAPGFVLTSVPSSALLVVNRGHSWLKHVVFGSVTRTVLADARADVLVV